MKIAAMTESPSLEGKIAKDFSSAGYLLILETDPVGVDAVYPRGELSDCDLAGKVVEHDCEAVLCGPIEEAPFVILADEGCVTRYQASGLTAGAALREMEAYRLPMIPDFIGGTGCGSGGEGACAGHHDHGGTEDE